MLKYLKILKLFVFYRYSLLGYLEGRDMQISRVTQLNSKVLQDLRVRALVLDYDGVLAMQDMVVPPADIVAWLENLTKDLPGLQIFILSNMPSQSRMDYIKQSFPGINFILPSELKPSPAGLNHIAETWQINKQQMLMVDDRLITGVLAAIQCPCLACWVTDSLGDGDDIKNIKQKFLYVLRSWEKKLLKLIT